MLYAEKVVANQPEILKVHTGAEYTAPITLASGAFVEGVCKAGSPITSAGLVDNEGATAIGILLTDVYEANPNGTILKAFGVVNTENAKKNGITIAEAVKGALPLVVFE